MLRLNSRKAGLVLRLFFVTNLRQWLLRSSWSQITCHLSLVTFFIDFLISGTARLHVTNHTFVFVNKGV